MYPKKPGGANKPQFYDPNDGQYIDITEEEKAKMLDEEISNMVLRYYFGFIDSTYQPRFPIYGFHNDEYCKMYVQNCISRIYRDFPWGKIKEYLLIKKERDDKSEFFKIHGYSQANAEKLYDQIMSGTDFSKMEYQSQNEHGIKIQVPTSIYSYREYGKIVFKSIWIYKKDGKMHFVTVVPKKERRK